MMIVSFPYIDSKFSASLQNLLSVIQLNLFGRCSLEDPDNKS